MRSGCERWAWLLLVAAGTVAADGPTAHLPPAVADLVGRLATCTAYYFNATNARPMAEYEALYGAGERSRNRALRYLDAADFDRLVGDAATVMTAMTGGDWRQFARVQARFGADCDALDESPPPAGD
ncbi:MAG: hypothetical protein RLW61_14605 [Gammaproteobacteria bacterium]